MKWIEHFCVIWQTTVPNLNRNHNWKTDRTTAANISAMLNILWIGYVYILYKIYGYREVLLWFRGFRKFVCCEGTASCLHCVMHFSIDFRFGILYSFLECWDLMCGKWKVLVLKCLNPAYVCWLDYECIVSVLCEINRLYKADMKCLVRNCFSSTCCFSLATQVIKHIKVVCMNP